ncbi:FecR family protein [Xanthovirga aplysinae]|uniref:FecR family protein n=1 Tax=Xanthovirga aplysinae TaxID=2529853 RepID=UPI0012BBEACF|nr:FecR family protein [Xanthovirga aplysinae]MTI33253.1 DUF4974 domain-containing protein [Xanthovirga aplysinae]
MNKTEFQQLITNYLNGNATGKEQKLIEDFYEELQNKEEGWEAFESDHKSQIKSEIFEKIQSRKGSQDHQKVVKMNTNIWMKIAASVIIVIGFAWTYFNFFESVQSDEWITKTSLTGQQMLVNLNDGSVVKLNNQSSVSYPKEFTDELREVRLEGEAYFDVVKDPERPFEVTAYGFKTSVLGTTFNINAFDSLSINVALLTGKVKVNNAAESVVEYLKPGEMASYDAINEKVLVNNFNSEKITAWQEKVIFFEDATYKQVFDELGRWYDVKFRFQNTPDEEWSVSGKFKNKTLAVVLETISFSEGFEFEINEKVVDIKFTQ